MPRFNGSVRAKRDSMFSSDPPSESSSTPRGTTASMSTLPTQITPHSSTPSSSVLSARVEEKLGFFSCVFGFIGHVVRLLKSLQEDQLPWTTDFFDWTEFSPPQSVEDVLTRLNLNIPFYAANYTLIFYLVTLPFLLLHDPLCFAILCVSSTLIHSIHFRERTKSRCGTKMQIGGFSILYQHLVDAHLVIFAILLFFFDGFRTVSLVVLLDSVIILPHVLFRQPTYFDDEELEKLRPKSLQYILSFGVMVLAYLECKGAGHLPRARKSKKKKVQHLLQ